MKKLILLIAVLAFAVTSFAQTEVKTVTSLTGEVWMAKNLGAERVAISIDDEAAYGDLYQWGRVTDGHEKRDSETTTLTTTSQTPETDKFIIGNRKSRYNWNKWDRWNLWNDNKKRDFDPCPEGFKVPSEQQWIEEMATWESLDNEGAFNSVLKIPSGGVRGWNGKIYVVGTFASFWTSTRSSIKKDRFSQFVEATNRPKSGNTYGTNRGSGLSIRCIKE